MKKVSNAFKNRKSKIVILLVIFSLSASGQEDVSFFSMDEAVALALANHPHARGVASAEQKDALLQKRAVEFAPVNVKYWQGGASGMDIERFWSVTQDFGSIPEHFRRAQHYRATASTRQAEGTLTIDEITWQTKAAYMDLVYYRQRLQIMQEHANYFEALISVAEVQIFTDDSIADLIKISTGARYAEYQRRMYIAKEEAKRAELRLRKIMYIADAKIEPSQTELSLYQIHAEKPYNERFEAVKHNYLDAAQIYEAESAVRLEKSKLFPSVHAGYINYNNGLNPAVGRYSGWMAGLSVSLWAQPQRARIKQAEIDAMAKIYETEYRQYADGLHIETLKSFLNEYFLQISFSKENLLIEAQLKLEEITTDFSAGRIVNFADTFTKASEAVYAKINHLEYIMLYNQTALELEFFTQ